MLGDSNDDEERAVMDDDNQNDIDIMLPPSSDQTTARTERNPSRRSAPIWQYFRTYYDEEKKQERAMCLSCRENYAIGSSSHGTTNLIRHKDRCPKRKYGDVGQMLINHEGALRAKKLDQNLYREKMAISIVKHNYPYSMVEHSATRDLHLYLNPSVKTYTRNTCKADVLKLYKREMERVRSDLAKAPGRVCLTSDVWTSITTEGYICLTGHYVDENWVLRSKILNFCYFAPPHTGFFMCDKVYQYLKEWGIEKKIFSITLDNASSCDNMQDHLKLKLKKDLLCNGKFFHVRCSAHILNLIVQDGLKVANDALHKIRESVKYVKGSQSRLMRFAECCKEEGVSCEMGLRLDVPTRWNSTYIMLRSALQYRSVFSLFAIHDFGYKKCPSEEEWNMAQKIHDLLKPFFVITTLFSGSDYPTANLYFENVWSIQKLLLEHKESEDPLIGRMACDMMPKFEKYWDDYSLVLALAFTLDPRNKLELVKYCYNKINVGTSEAKLQNVEDALESLFQEYAHLYSIENTRSDSRMDIGVGAETASALFEDKSELDNFEDDIEDCTTSELQKFKMEAKISRRASNKNFDVLKWWKDNSPRYPILSRMARDLMAIPITTVASESTFSIGAKILTKYRSSLRPYNAEALVCTRNWLSGYEIEDELEEDDHLVVPIQTEPAHTMESAT